MFVTCNTKNRIIRSPKGATSIRADRVYDSSFDPSIGTRLVSDILTLTPPHGSHGSYLFKYEYLARNVTSKLSDDLSKSPEQRRTAAIDKMLLTEEVCRRINTEGYHHRSNHLPLGYLSSVMHVASGIVSSILGDFTFDCLNDFRFSGGASTSKTRRHGHPYYKYGAKDICDVTLRCLPYAMAIQKTVPIWYSNLGKQKLNIVCGNRITTVPKNSSIDRTIAMEPDMNMGLQLSVGKYIRSRLKTVGIDLHDQTKNQRLAKSGSLLGNLSTIDLASASDSISYRLVMDLLPFQWFNHIENLRAPRGILPDGKTLVWEKFSSMGNGYTFELETLIFFSLAKAVAITEGVDYKDITVYGDDIIVPVSCAHNVIAVLKAVGFETNLDKTFITGPFRESCGKHYYEGIDVTPFYIRRSITTWTDYINIINKLRLWSTDELSNMLDPHVYDVWARHKEIVPRRLRGGRDYGSNLSLVTPGRPRDKLVPKWASVCHMHGWRLLLAILQNKRDTDTPCVDTYIRVDSPSTHEIYLPTPLYYRYKPNTDWWLPLCSYPQEVRHSW